MTNLDNAFFDKIANALSTLTDGRWYASIDTYGNRSIVEAGSGLSLYVRVGGYGNEGKITISYDRPRDDRGDYVEVYHPMGGGKIADPSIRVSASKTPEVIAKDIVRRMLDAAKNVHVLVLERIESNAEYHTKKNMLTKEIADICHATVKADHLHASEVSINPYESITPRADFRCGYGSITVSSDSAEFKLTSVPAALAKKLAAVIHETLKNHANRTA
jgi:uncharacterized protein YdhG (YjbR/CyaY superfamily)